MPEKIDIDPTTGKPTVTVHNTVVALGVWLLTLTSLAIKALVITWVIKQVWY